MNIKKLCCVLCCFALLPFSVGSSGAVEIIDVPESWDDVIQNVTMQYGQIPEDYFGGYFLADDGSLVINVTKEYYESKEFKGCELSSRYVSFHIVEYSIIELESMKEALVPYMIEYGIASLDANEMTNTVDVELYYENEDFSNLVKRIPFIDSNVLRISVLDDGVSFDNAVLYESDILDQTLDEDDLYDINATMPELAIYPGMLLRNVSDDAIFTAGPRSDDQTFFSAGHCASNGDRITMYYNIPVSPPYSNHIGSVVYSYFGASGDLCEIAVENLGVMPSGYEFENGHDYSIGYTCIAGESVELLGGFSGLVSGEVLRTNVTVSYDGTIVGGLIRTSIRCQRGDSGGGLFSRNSYSWGSGKAYGVLSGGLFSSGSSVSNESYFNPI